MFWWQLGNAVFFDFWAFWAAARGPLETPKMDFAAVLSALWSKRKCANEGVSLVAGAGGGHPDPLGDRLGAKTVVSGPVSIFLGSGRVFWWQLGKAVFFYLWAFWAAARGPQEA